MFLSEMTHLCPSSPFGLFKITFLFFNFFQTIDRVMQIENDFFPLISGELGDSLQQTNQLQARLDQFVPIYQVFSLVTFENAQLSY